MVKIKSIPGIMWASDIMTGQRPIPMHTKPKESSADFKKILDAEMEKLERGDAEKR